jgi:glycosyltransferase involved in cell wall biosynthesis
VERGAAAVAFCDADCEYDPAELERLVAPILEGRADYVVGSRFAGEIRRMLPQRRLGNLALTGLLRFVARAPIGDGQSGFRALSRAAAAEAEIVHDYNYAQVLTLDLLAKRHRYLEVPIGYRFRTTGRSFVRPLRYLRQVVPTVWRELDRHHRAAASSSRSDPRPVHPAPRLVHPAPGSSHPDPRLTYPDPRFTRPDPRFTHPAPGRVPRWGSVADP